MVGWGDGPGTVSALGLRDVVLGSSERPMGSASRRDLVLVASDRPERQVELCRSPGIVYQSHFCNQLPPSNDQCDAL